MDIVEGLAPSETKEETTSGLRADAVEVPATPGCFVRLNGRNGDTSISYSGREAVRRGIVSYLLKARTVEPEEQPLLGNRPANTPVARQWLNSRYVMAVTDTYATIEEMLEAVFSVPSVPRLYNNDQLPLPFR
jgi:hypothetical protein